MIVKHLALRALVVVAGGFATAALAGSATGGLTGRLTDAVTAGPIVGAQVFAYDATITGQGTVTDGDGRYVFPALPIGAWRVRTDAVNHLDELFDNVPCENGACDVASMGTPVSVTTGNLATADFVLAPGGGVAGLVTGPGNVPLANVQILVMRLTGELAASLLTGADGRYETPRSLAAGSYRVGTLNPYALVDEVYPDLPCPGGAGCDVSDGGTVAVAAGTLATGIDLQLAAGAYVSGQVTAAIGGAPVSGVGVYAFRGDEIYAAFAISAPDGQWQSPALPPGEWRFVVQRQGALLGEVWPQVPCDIDCQPSLGSPVTVAGVAPVTGIDFTLDGGTRLAGTVTAATGGAAVANALVSVNDPVRGQVAFAFSEANGSYVTEAFKSGTVRLVASAPEFLVAAFGEPCEPDCGPTSGALLSPPAGLSGGYDFALQSGGAIRGTVTGPNGPLANAQVVVLQSDGDFATAATTDGAGNYDTGEVLGGGAYRVRTTSQAGAIDEAWPNAPCPAAACDNDVGDLVAVTVGQTTVADFTLAAGARITGQVRRASDNAAIDTPIVRVTDGDGLLAYFYGAPDGSFDTFTGLPPGNYHVVASSPNSGLLSEAWPEQPCSNCAATAGSPIAITGTSTVGGIDFTLDAGATISGRVTDASTAQPVAGVTVIVIDEESDRPIAFAYTAPDGRYRTDSFEPRAVRLIATTPGYVDAIPGGAGCVGGCYAEDGPLLQPAAGDLPNIDFALRRGSRVSGRVLAPGGAPVAGASVLAGSDDWFGQAVTAADGSYTISDLPDGRFFVYVEGMDPYVPTAWPSVQCTTFCDNTSRDTLELEAGDDVDGIDITLIEGGFIVGRIEGMPGNIAQPGFAAIYESTGVQNVGQPLLAAGEYRSPALPPGHYVVYSVTTGGYIDELFDDVPCPYTCEPDLGALVTVTSGNDTRADFELAQGGRVAGRIFNAGSNAALPARPSAQVRAADNTLLWSGTVQSNGTWTSAALPPGTYYVRSRNRSGFVDEFYLDEDCFWCTPVGGVDPSGQAVTVTPIGITLGATTGGIDQGLLPGRRLSGRVTRELGGSAAPQVVVAVHDANGIFVSSVSSASDGTWITSNGLPPGTYYLRTQNDGRFIDELLGGATCGTGCVVTQGTPVVVAGNDLTGLDFALRVMPALFRNGFE